MFCLPLIILFFWSLHSLRRIFFFLYFWQLKEYRLDRFLEEAKRKRKIIFSKFFFLALIFFFLWLIFPNNRLVFEILILILYLFFGSYSTLLFLKNKWIFPKFTKKIILFFVFAVMSEAFLVWQFFNDFFLFILVLEILFPIFIFLCLRVIEIPVFFTKEAMKRKAKMKIEKFSKLTTIGITGSYGKTSTKEILYSLLSRDENVLKTSDHTNTEMGVAKTVLGFLKEKHEFFICEMAAYKRGEVQAISNMVKPKIGILTGINQQHLSLFGSQENIIKGKYELIEAIPENGVAIFNGDNKYCLELYKKTNKPKRIYSVEEKLNGVSLDIWAEDIRIEKEFTSFRVVCKDKETADFKIRLLGKHSVSNILGAICVAKEIGMSLQDISDICSEIKPQLGGIILKQGINGLNIIDSSYSANPDGVISSLDYLDTWGGKKAIILPGLIELGSSSEEVHRKIEKKIEEVCDIAITTSKGVFKKINFISDTKEIIEKLEGVDVVLLEGRIPRDLVNKLLINNN
ncbi:MAG: Mur ligase family protein [Patescibacteria group bacterium]|nr:Mur ligase family protein [Patescibacteria group bacterium]